MLSNKRAAEKAKLKTTKDAVDEPSSALALKKLLNLASYTGRDKFRTDCHDEIHEHSKTLPGSINAGGKFRKAEALLWAKEDHASWEAAVRAAEENVDYQESVPLRRISGTATNNACLGVRNWWPMASGTWSTPSTTPASSALSWRLCSWDG